MRAANGENVSASGSLADSHVLGVDPAAKASASTSLTILAFAITLLISRLPEITLRDVAGMEIPSLAW